jgi:SRSO17 transposase
MSSHVTVRGPGGQTAIELYLPEPGTGNPDQCRAAGIPDGTMFAIKPKLARRMVARTLGAGVPAEWAAGDEICGADLGCARTWRSARSGTC